MVTQTDATAATAQQDADLVERTEEALTNAASPDAPPSLWSYGRQPLVLGTIVLGLLARIVFWAMTDRRFEDGLITVAHAQSAASGIGLTHHPYEPVTHGFTTALSVLTPYVGELIGKVVPLMDGFTMLRLTSLVTFALSALFLARICEFLKLPKWATIFPLAYLAFDQNLIFYGMSGMETQIVVAVLLGGIDALLRRSVVALGVALGLAPLARPELAVLWCVPAVIGVFLWRRDAAFKVTGIAALITGPWILFTTLYYGSPIPNTIVAKDLRYPTEFPSLLAGPSEWTSFLYDRVAERATTWHLVTPFLENGLTIRSALPPFVSANIAFVFVGLAILGFVSTRKATGWKPVLVFVAAFAAYRMIYLPTGYYEWYYPPVLVVAAILVAAGLARVGNAAPKTAKFTAGLLAFAFAMHMPFTFVLEQRVQHDVEDQVRVPMALWLHHNVPPGQTVTSESAGYVGYYGRVKLYDYPGLTSKETVAIMKRLGTKRNSMFELINAARPNFVVIRPSELYAFKQANAALLGDYTEVKRFSVPRTPALERGNVTYVNIDTDFIVLKRNP